MAQSKITIIGLENYLARWNRSIFDGVTFPDGIDRENAINQIILDSGEFEILYSDPDFLTEAVTLWSKNRYYTFQKWLEGLLAKFSPIENYDRYEEYEDGETTGNTRTNDLTKTNNLTRTDDLVETHDLTETHDITDTTHMTDTNDVSAYDTSGYSPKSKDSKNGTVENDGTIKDTGTLKNTGTVKDTGNIKDTGTVKDEGSRKLKHEAHIHGNIGVTTGQQLVEGFLELYGSNNIYEMIAADFVTRFCIMVY